MQIQARLRGADEAIATFQAFPTRFLAALKEATKHSGEHILRQVRKRIKAEGPGWPRLSRAYAEQRSRLGYGRGPILRRRGKLYEGIKFEQINYKKGQVGWHEWRYRRLRGPYPKHPRTYAQIGIFHEQPVRPGTIMPRRPFFEPVAKQQITRRFIRAKYRTALRKALRK